MSSVMDFGFLSSPDLEALVAAILPRLDVHLFIEGIFVAVICYLLFQKSYKPNRSGDRLTEKEVDELCESWQPEPLASSAMADLAIPREEKVISAQGGSTVVLGGVEHVNFSCLDFLSFLGEGRVHDACEATIRKYGVGSCGPRGFYGTIDVHLELESKLADFMGTEAGIIYSYDVATVSSVIPAFLKRGDLVICDEGVSWAVQSGIDLSRCYVKEFKHNDMSDLERILGLIAESDAKNPPKTLNRRFIIVEGLYLSTGHICNLKQVVELADKYKFRVLLEETGSFGVLGKTGRGCLEHWGMKATDVSLICASMSSTLATVGGFCVSDDAIVSHQRLSSASYCFSASLPPFNATAALEAIRIIETEPERLAKLRANTAAMHRALQKEVSLMGGKGASDSLVLVGDEASPLMHLFLRDGSDDRVKDDRVLQTICDSMSADSRIALSVCDSTPLVKKAPKPSIRVTVSSGHTSAQIAHFATSLRSAASKAFCL